MLATRIAKYVTLSTVNIVADVQLRSLSCLLTYVLSGYNDVYGTRRPDYMLTKIINDLPDTVLKDIEGNVRKCKTILKKYYLSM